MASLYSDANLPKYIYICGLIGIVFLIISLASFLVFFFAYHKKNDLSVNQSNLSYEENLTFDISLSFLLAGLLFCFFILYGHILKQKRDPQLVFGNKSYIEFPENGEFVPIEEESSLVYGTNKKYDRSSSSFNSPELNTDFL